MANGAPHTQHRYAGVYIPMIIEQIDLHKGVPNFAGAAIGTGLGCTHTRAPPTSQCPRRARTRARAAHIHACTVSLNTFHLAEILVLVGGAIPPAPAVPASTRIPARLQRVQGHVSPQGEEWVLTLALIHVR